MQELVRYEDGGLTATGTKDVFATSATAKAQYEIQGAMILAKKFPRNQAQCYSEAMKSMARQKMAERACYSYPRGATTVSGPSTYLARELARVWGNMRSGFDVSEMTDERITIDGWAWDLETNTRSSCPASFRPLVQRKVRGQDGLATTKWVQPDERDLRELINKHGAIAQRNAILQIIPEWLKDEAVEESKKTLKSAAAGELRANRDDAIRKLVAAFDKLGVTNEMLERRLGHDTALITEDELVDLRQIWTTLNDGQAKRDEYFSFAEPEAEDKQPDANDTLKAKLKARREQKDSEDK